MVSLALVVLGSSRRDRAGVYRISRACRRVVARAAQLAEELEPRVVVFSGWSPNGGPSEAEQMQNLWRGPELELVLEPTASTTAENAARTLPLLPCVFGRFGRELRQLDVSVAGALACHQKSAISG